MTPKEKAQQLLDRFDLPTGLRSAERKQCALICVDEMIDVIYGLPNNEKKYNYLQEVKSEIEKL